MSHHSLETRDRSGPFIESLVTSQHYGHTFIGAQGQKAEAISALLAPSIIQITALSIFMSVYLHGWYPQSIIVQNWERFTRNLFIQVLITSILTQLFFHLRSLAKYKEDFVLCISFINSLSVSLDFYSELMSYKQSTGCPQFRFWNHFEWQSG